MQSIVKLMDGSVALPFQFGPHTSYRIVVWGRVNGSVPLPFALDTAFPGEVLLFAHAVRQINGADPSRSSERETSSVTVERFAFVADSKEVCLHTGSFSALVDKSSYAPNVLWEPLRIAGLVGLRIFHNSVIGIDFDDQMLFIGQRGLGKQSGRYQTEGFPLTDIDTNLGALKLVDLPVGGKVAKLLVDTAAFESYLPAWLSHNEECGILFPFISPLPFNTMLTYEVVWSSLTLANRQWSNLTAALWPCSSEGIEIHPAIDGIVGLEVMSRFNTILDLREGVMFFFGRRKQTKPIRRGWLGLVVSRKERMYVIDAIDPQSPVNKRLLRAGYYIKRVDGIELQHLSPVAVHLLLSGWAGTNAKIEAVDPREPKKVISTIVPRIALPLKALPRSKSLGMLVMSSPATSAVVAFVIPGTVSEKVGLRPGDELVSVDGKRLLMTKVEEIVEVYAKLIRRRNKVNIQVKRGEGILSLQLPAG